MSDILFILGAGASRECRNGTMPTYRGPNGIYENGDIDPEEILNPTQMRQHPKLIWSFLAPLYLCITKLRPGSTYSYLKGLAEIFPDSLAITQNVDGFIQSTHMDYIELHGNIHRMICMRCEEGQSTNLSSLCCDCGGYFRPDIILFREDINEDDLIKASLYIKTRPKYVIIIGTTLTFPYLRGLINQAKKQGAQIIHINPDPDYQKNIHKNEQWIQKSASEGLRYLWEILEASR